MALRRVPNMPASATSQAIVRSLRSQVFDKPSSVTANADGNTRME
jgi:hypothetical protein